MASESGNETDSLIERLLESPFDFNLFQTLRRIHAMYPDSPYIGDAKRPREEKVRLGQKVSLNFAPSHIADAKMDEERGILGISVYGPGLAGAQGPMPIPLSEFIIRRKRDFRGDETLADFLNIFNHRFLTLLYKAWALSNKAVEVERGGESLFVRHLGSLIGIGMQSMQGHDSVDDFAKLYFSGHLSRNARNTTGLESVLTDFFQIPARVVEFEGQWLTLPENTRCRLGATPETGLVGRTLIVGSKIWECQLKFKIIIGPVDLAQLERMLPHGSAFKRLKDWIRSYTQDPLAWDLQIIVKKESVPRTQLGGNTYLGWTSWMFSDDPLSDPDDLVLKGDQ